MSDWNPPPGPQPPRGRLRAGPVVGGLFLGLLLAFVYTIAAIFVGTSMVTASGSQDLAIIVSWSLPAVIGVLLLAFERTRRAGAGFVMGISIGFILLSTVCVGPAALLV